MSFLRRRSSSFLCRGHCQRPDLYCFPYSRLLRVVAAIMFFVPMMSIFADDEAKFDWFKPFSSLTGEYSVEETYVSDASVIRSNKKIEDFNESDTILRFVATPRIKLGVLRLGIEWEYFSFGFPNNTPLPNTFQELSAIIGLDTQISNSILVRVEAAPGFY